MKSIRVSALTLSAVCLFHLGPSSSLRAAGKKPDAKVREEAKKLYLEGRKLFALGRFRPALKRFEKAYQLLPLPGFLFNIAQCHRLLGKCDRAIFFYKGYLADDPDSPNTPVVKKLILRCDAEVKQRQAKRAESRKLFVEGKKQITIGRYQAALGYFNRAYQMQPLAGYLFSIAQAYRGLKNWAKAIEFYQAYLADNPGTPKENLVKGLIAECDKKIRADSKGRLGRGLLPGGKPGVRESNPVYKRWWFWTLIVVGVGAAVGAGLGLTLGRRGGSDLPTTDLPLVDWR